jgi:calcium-dependent protein kinase
MNAVLLPRAAISGAIGVPTCFTRDPSKYITETFPTGKGDDEGDFLIREGAKHGDFLQFFVSGGTFSSTYTVENKIGEGAFGKVFAARHNVLGILRAVKRLKKTSTSGEMHRNEVAALLALDHPHIVKLVEYFDQEDEYLYLVFELCAGPDLFDYIRQQETGRMTEFEASLALRHMLKALQCCHAQYRGHFDIKPENFMYTTTERSNLKMIDLGLSSGFESHPHIQKIRGTQNYMAPEFWDGIYGPEGDVWSCGVVLFVMLTGEDFLSDIPFSVMKREIKVRANMRSRLEDAATKVHLSADALQLLTLMLQHDRHARPTVRECLRHPFITNGYAHESEPSYPLESPVTLEALEIRARLPDIFRAFAAEPMLKQAFRLAFAHACPACAAERLCFRMLDKHGYGEISIGSLEQDILLRDAEVPADLDTLFETVDMNRDGYIGVLAFLAVTLPSWMCNDMSVCRVAFDMLDKGRDGFIDASDLAHTFGHPVGAPICQSVLAEVCHDGRLSFEHFVQIMHTG